MPNETDENENKHEMRVMWGFSAAVVLLILGMMGVNMLFHHPSEAESTEISSQSRVAPPQ